MAATLHSINKSQEVDSWKQLVQQKFREVVKLKAEEASAKRVEERKNECTQAACLVLEYIHHSYGWTTEEAQRLSEFIGKLASERLYPLQDWVHAENAVAKFFNL